MHDLVMKTTLRTLADHLGVEPTQLRSRDRLEDDWDLEPSDLVVLALDLADELDRVISLGALAQLETIGDLVETIRRSPTSAQAVDEIPPSMRDTLPMLMVRHA